MAAFLSASRISYSWYVVPLVKPQGFCGNRAVSQRSNKPLGFWARYMDYLFSGVLL